MRSELLYDYLSILKCLTKDCERTGFHTHRAARLPCVYCQINRYYAAKAIRNRRGIFARQESDSVAHPHHRYARFGTRTMQQHATRTAVEQEREENPLSEEGRRRPEEPSQESYAGLLAVRTCLPMLADVDQNRTITRMQRLSDDSGTPFQSQSGLPSPNWGE